MLNPRPHRPHLAHLCPPSCNHIRVPSHPHLLSIYITFHPSSSLSSRSLTALQTFKSLHFVHRDYRQSKRKRGNQRIRDKVMWVSTHLSHSRSRSESILTLRTRSRHSEGTRCIHRHRILFSILKMQCKSALIITLCSTHPGNSTIDHSNLLNTCLEGPFATSTLFHAIHDHQLLCWRWLRARNEGKDSSEGVSRVVMCTGMYSLTIHS